MISPKGTLDIIKVILNDVFAKDVLAGREMFKFFWKTIKTLFAANTDVAVAFCPWNDTISAATDNTRPPTPPPPKPPSSMSFAASLFPFWVPADTDTSLLKMGEEHVETAIKAVVRAVVDGGQNHQIRFSPFANA